MTDTQSTGTTRAQQHAAELAAGLRALADVLAANPDLGQQALYTRPSIIVPAEDKTQLVEFVRAAKAHGAIIVKSASDTSKYFSALCRFGPVTLDVYVPRDEVCERVVVSTETVTRMVPDPVALAAVPQVEVTDTVENVRWECKPLLAPEPAPDGLAGGR